MKKINRVLPLLAATALWTACPPSPPPDAGVDSGEPDVDSGEPEVDAGEPDAGEPEEDAGEPDAGPPDAGGPEEDAGPPDAGEPEEDAGEPDEDAGQPDDDGGIVVVGGTCGEPSPFSGTSAEGDTTGFSDNLSGSCVGEGSSEQVFTYTVSSTSRVVVTATPTDDNFDLGIYVRTACDDADSELECSDSAGRGGEDDVDLGVVAAGTQLFIVVDGFTGFDGTPAAGTFTVAVDEQQITILNSGDACDRFSDTEFCNVSANEFCLSVDDVFTCQVQTVLNAGDACNEDDTGRVCNLDNDEFCLTVDGVFTCQAETILVSGDACNPEDSGRICDFFAGDECLSVEGSFTCQVATVLALGDACNPEDTGRICDGDNGDVCSDNAGDGVFQCRNGAAEKCLAAVEINNDPVDGELNEDDGAFFTASSGSGFEDVYVYTVQGSVANVTIDVASAPIDLVLYARTECNDEDSQVGPTVDAEVINPGDETLSVNRLAGGTQLFIYVDSFSAFRNNTGSYTITVTEEEVLTLLPGEECDPEDTVRVCDPTDGNECLSRDGVFTCQQEEVLASGAACNPDDTAAICDASLGEVCNDAETADTFVCSNPNALACVAPETVLTASPLTSNFTANSTNVREATCGFGCDSGLAEDMYVYTVQNGGTVTVRADSTGADIIVSVETVCGNDDALVTCRDGAGANTPETVTLNNRTAGETLFIYVEQCVEITGSYTLTVTEQ